MHSAPLSVITDDFCLPSILLWNPLLSYEKYVKISCPECGSESIRVKYWNDGSCPSRQPRMLHTLDNIVLLVSSVYTCNKGHECLAHDARILALFPSEIEIPFVLVHRTGFTADFLEMCNSFVRRGMNFYNMESMIIESRWRMYVRNYNRFTFHVGSTHSGSLEGFQSSSLSNTPSDYLLTKCFLAKFSRQEQFYLSEMCSIQIGHSISFDHTFKVAANIGYYREDKVWVSQYNSLFLVMNSNGKVVTWQLTSGTSLDQVQTVLRDVYERSKKQEEGIEIIYVDDCCKVRKKLKTIFGDTVQIKLDLFHAVQRITRTLPKSHLLFHQCVSELRNVFREDGDVYEERKVSTPSPEVMEKNMDEFVKRWRCARDSSGNPIFRADTHIAINNIIRHIKIGCLSQIPPGGGTTKNERFHQHMKTYFHRSRIGVFLAYALLSVIIHQHNSHTKIKQKVVLRPIEAGPFTPETGERPTPVGIVLKMHKYATEYEQCEIDLSDKEIDIEMTVKVYLASLKKLVILNTLQTAISKIMLCSIGFFKPFLPGLSDESNAVPTEDDIHQEVKKQLSVYGLRLHPSSEGGVGNCFFYSLAKGLLESPSTWHSTLTNKGISNENISSMPHKLRLLFVQELSGVLHEHYRSFTTLMVSEYHTETSKFAQDGHYDSCIGNLMPLCMANVLHASFVIIRPYNKPLYVTPEDNVCHGTIFLVYQCSGKGHYDAALPSHATTNLTTSAEVENVDMKCSCGKNSKGEVPSCAYRPLYASRCKCYNSGVPCSVTCKCKNCNNPHGKRVKPSETSTKRKRHRHTLQMDLPCSKKFASDSGEDIADGVWSQFETLVVNEIVATLSYSKSIYDATNATIVYNKVQYYSSASFCTFPLPANVVFRIKTVKQVDAKLKFMFRDRI